VIISTDRVRLKVCKLTPPLSSSLSDPKASASFFGVDMMSERDAQPEESRAVLSPFYLIKGEDTGEKGVGGMDTSQRKHSSKS